MTEAEYAENQRILDEWAKEHGPIGIDEALDWARGEW